MNKQEAKADAGKLEIDLVPTQIIRDIAAVRMYGNQKYGDPENWKTVELRRYVNALLRHTLAFMEDYKSVDEESGIAHYRHMACNLAFICELLKEPRIIEVRNAKIVPADTEPRLIRIPTTEEMNTAIQEYCCELDCDDCAVTLICESISGAWLANPEELKMAYNIIKEEEKRGK